MIAIIDYKAGNLTSVARAVSHIGVECVVTGDADIIRNAERIIFPGVGAAGSAMESLKSLGLDNVIISAFILQLIIFFTRILQRPSFLSINGWWTASLLYVPVNE